MYTVPSRLDRAGRGRSVVAGLVLLTAVTPASVAAQDAASGFEHLATWDASTIEGLDQPCGGDMGPDRLFYLVNCGTSEVLVLDTDGDVVRRWGGPGTAEGQFDFRRDPNDPFSDTGGVAVSPDGSIFVADTVNRRVQQFDSQGEFVRQFGSYGDGDGQFLEPIDLDVGPDGTVYVVDDVRDDIQRFSAEGKYLQTIGAQGDAPGYLQQTGSIVVTDDGRLLNADWSNWRVQAWDADGNFLWTVGTWGSDPGEFKHPVDVAVDDAGRWFASDVTDDHGRVQAFGPDNELLGEWKPSALGDEDPPIHITAAGDGRLYVNLPFSDRIAVIEFA